MRTVVVTVAVLVTLGLAALGVVASRNGSLPSAPIAPTASSDQGKNAPGAPPAQGSPVRVVSVSSQTTVLADPASSAPASVAPQRVAQNTAGRPLEAATATDA